MKKLKPNKALQGTIDAIRNNPYVEKIIDISDIKLLDGTDKYIVSETQGEYPTTVRFTAMQEVTVTYINKYFGKMTDRIVAGFDAIRYTDCHTDAYQGDYMSGDTVKVEFVGEYAKIL